MHIPRVVAGVLGLCTACCRCTVATACDASSCPDSGQCCAAGGASGQPHHRQLLARRLDPAAALHHVTAGEAGRLDIVVPASCAFIGRETPGLMWALYAVHPAAALQQGAQAGLLELQQPSFAANASILRCAEPCLCPFQGNAMTMYHNVCAYAALCACSRHRHG